MTTNEIREYFKNEKIKFSALFDDILQNDCKYYNEYDLLLLSVCKRAVDVTDTIAYAARTCNINTLYPLIRLQIDSCLIIRAALLLKDNKKFFEKISDRNFELREFKNPVDNTPLSERKLAKLIDEDYPDFFKFYDYCCDFVHFTEQTLNLPIRNVNDLAFYVNDAIGNKENKYRVKIAIENFQNTNKTLFDLIQKCRLEFPENKDIYN